ncbi:Rrp15p-domain-containing protein [Pisolithus croceorrhizus]|nr:Rrp15p-domain-containing protein [Pisolithus croceorrhizus]
MEDDDTDVSVASEILSTVAGGGDTEECSPQVDTDDAISPPGASKTKATLKRKRRATGPSQFGTILQSLLETETPSALPLSLKPSIARQRNDARLELKARKMIQVERKEKEDRGRIRDVIEGWGAESERSLRKVAQRGVVKLFNSIQQSQTAAAAAEAEALGARGTGKPALPAPTLDSRDKGKRKNKQKDNLIGRGKESTVDKDSFFDLIRSGGIVSKV